METCLWLMLGLVVVYSFKVNPLLAVGIVGAVVLVKRRVHKKGASQSDNSANNMAMVLLLTQTLGQETREKRRAPVAPVANAQSSTEDDPLGGLFRD